MVDVDRIAWARAEAERLRGLGRTENLDAEVAQAMEFLDRQAPESQFVAAAHKAFETPVGEGYAPDTDDITRRIAIVLIKWCEYVESGLEEALPFEVSFRIEAAGDLMEQVRLLLADSTVHPAAAVMLAGAALEEALRSLIVEHSVTFSGKPGIDAYAGALRSDDVISKQQKKDIDSVAGVRNDAAHGHFDNIARPNATLMEQQVNLLLSQLRPS